jgi:hypothetical protein
MFISVPDRIRIRPKVSDPYGSGSGSTTLLGTGFAIRIQREKITHKNRKKLINFMF